MSAHSLTISASAAQRGGQSPHIVIILPRGEAVRNFVYSDTLSILAERARVTLLSAVTGPILDRFRGRTDQILELENYPPHSSVALLRGLIDLAHFRWLNSEVARETRRRRVVEAPNHLTAAKRSVVNGLTALLANRSCLRLLDRVERKASWKLRATDHFLRLWSELRPDLVFNGSHVHGAAADEPVRAAHQLGIPTAAFIFSWDNLTSRGRIMAPYDYYFVWNEGMKEQLLRIYPWVEAERVFAAGTPQLDFHFKEQFRLSRAELCRRIGADPERPMVLYTTGMDSHFPEEHRTVAFVAEAIHRLEIRPRPQLVVRTYVKGTSQEMRLLASRNLPDVIFPEVLWEEKWKTPLYEDLSIYSALLREAAVGINVASTVSLELIIHDKPVINIGFDPPGSRLSPLWQYERHLRFDHYEPVVQSGAVMVARSPSHLESLLAAALKNPSELQARRAHFRKQMFGDTLDGGSAARVARTLFEIGSSETRRKAAVS